MAEGSTSTLTGGAADWLAWLTDPKAPMPLDLSSKRSGTPYGGRTYGGQTFGGQTYGDPNAAAAIAAQPSGVPDATSIVQYATNPKAPPPDVSISGPDLSGLSAPPSLGQSARAPAQPPRATAPWPTGPQPAIVQSAPPNRFGPRIPTPGAPPEAQNTSNMIDTVMGWFGRGNTPSQAIVSDATAGVIPGALPRPQMGRPQLSGQQTAMGGTPPPPPPVPSPVPATPAVPSPSQQQPGVPPGSPGAPPAPTVPEDQSDNVAMGTGPGRAVSHDQAAAISGAAVNLGTKVAQDPSIVSSILKDLSTKGLSDNDENAWLALANAGFATMASRSPFVGQAIGEGAQAGLASYQQSRAARAQQLTGAAALEQRQQGLEQQGQQIKQTGEYQQGTLDQRDKEFQAELNMKLQTMPYDLALKSAQAAYYKDHGDYYQGKIGQGGGTGSGRGGGSYLSRAAMAIHDANVNAGMSDEDAWTDAILRTKGTQNSQENQLANQYIRAAGFSTDINNSPADLANEARIWARQQIAGGGGAPAPQRTASAGEDPLVAQARDAIAKGADPAAVKARLKANGVDPALLGS